MLSRILSDPEDELVREERQVLARLRTALVRFDAAPDQQQALQKSIEQLDELFLLVIVGEFNAGKSAFINAIVGSRVALEGVTPTTAQINVLQYGETVQQEVRGPALRIITAPAPLLREIHIVDTPGTNAIMREHEAITAEFVPRSDLVLFVTSADRPFTETERAFLEQVRGWGKKVVVVINKIDILEGERQVEEVTTFVRDSARALLGFSPEIFPVSARLALRAKQGDPTVWAASRFEALEQYIRDTLDSPGRVQLKLLNPLGVGAAVTARLASAVQERAALLKDDFATLEEVEGQLAIYQQDLLRDFEFRISDIDRILLEMEKRGQEYFDDTMRLGRVMDLLNRSRMQQGFEHQVIADAPQQIERKVGELVDWLVDADLRQWQDVTRHLAQRRRQYRGPDRRRRRLRPLQLRSDPAPRCGQPGVAARDRLLRPAEGGERPRRRRTERGRRRGRGQCRCARARRHRDPRGDDHRRRCDRNHDGLGTRRARLLHPAGEAREGQAGDAGEDRGRSSAPLRCAPRAVRPRDREERRTDSRKYCALQPIRQGGGREAAHDRAGAWRDWRHPRRAAGAH